MKARYQYRFYPTDRQQRDLTQLCDRVGAFWNDTLTLGKDSEKLPATGELQKLGVTLGKQTSDREWLGNALAFSLQQSINDLGVAYKFFFDSLKGNRKCQKVKLPKFKKKTNWQDTWFTRSSCSLKSDRVYLTKIQPGKICRIEITAI